MSTTRTILAAVKAAIAADHGSGYDLSGTGVVMTGAYPEPPFGQLFVCLWPEAAVMSDDWLDVREPTYQQSLMVMGWAPAASHDPAGRIDAALALGEVLSAAVHSVWLGGSPPSLVWDHRLTVEVVDPALTDLGITSHGLVAMELSYKISGSAGSI